MYGESGSQSKAPKGETTCDFRRVARKGRAIYCCCALRGSPRAISKLLVSASPNTKRAGGAYTASWYNTSPFQRCVFRTTVYFPSVGMMFSSLHDARSQPILYTWCVFYFIFWFRGRDMIYMCVLRPTLNSNDHLHNTCSCVLEPARCDICTSQPRVEATDMKQKNEAFWLPSNRGQCRVWHLQLKWGGVPDYI